MFNIQFYLYTISTMGYLITIEGNLLVISSKANNKFGCNPDTIIIKKDALGAIQTNYEDESIQLILIGAPAIWLYFADSSVGEDNMALAISKIRMFMSL